MLWELGFLLFFLLLFCVRVVYQYERALVFTLGKFSGLLEPGLSFIIPLVQWTQTVDLRVRVFSVPPQDTITKDNVSITVDAVIYYKIVNPGASVIEVSDFASAISQLAQTSMRNAIGEVPLDALLSQRDEISDKIKVMVDKVSTPWGIKVISLQLKHIELPDDMKRVMAKAAEAERFKKATIIRSEGENIAAEAIAQAAGILNSADGALNLRTLQSLNDIASDPSNTVTFFVPLDIIKNYSGDAKSSKRK